MIDTNAYRHAPSGETSMRKAAKKLNVTLKALKQALQEFSKAISVNAQSIVDAFKEVKKQREDNCDEQFDLPRVRFESWQGRGSQLQLPRRKPLQLESTYGSYRTTYGLEA